MIAGNYLPAMGYVVKTNLLRSIGAWTDDNMVEDWDIWLKLSKEYKFYFVNENVAFYRLHDSNTVSTSTIKLTLDSIKLLKRESRYAISNGYSQQLYEGLASQDLSLMKLRSKFFINSFLRNVFSYEYCKHFLKKICLHFFK